jgi:hypothetical protein
MLAKFVVCVNNSICSIMLLAKVKMCMCCGIMMLIVGLSEGAEVVCGGGCWLGLRKLFGKASLGGNSDRK